MSYAKSIKASDSWYVYNGAEVRTEELIMGGYMGGDIYTYMPFLKFDFDGIKKKIVSSVHFGYFVKQLSGAYNDYFYLWTNIAGGNYRYINLCDLYSLGQKNSLLFQMPLSSFEDMMERTLEPAEKVFFIKNTIQSLTNKIASSRALSENERPYLEFEVTDIVPLISNISPRAGVLDHAVENVFTWSFALTATTGYVHQMPVEAGAEIQWRIAGDATVHTLTSSQQGRISIPAYTFTDQTTIEWRMRAKTDDDIWSAWSDETEGSWFTITIGDAALIASNLSPSGQYIDASKPYTFKWDYSSGLGRPQASFEAEINYDNDPGWVSFFSGVGTAQSYTVPANALDGGGMRWRIRVTNDRGTVSDWSEEAQNRVVARPDTPDISGPDTPAVNAIISNISRPTITWQAAGQLAFQLLVLSEDGLTLIHDSGIVNTKVASYKIPIFLENGRYIIKVRVQNEFAMYSEYGVVNAFIEADKPDSAKLVASSLPNGVRLTVSNIDDTATSIIIYRYSDKGYIPVAKIDPSIKTWADYACVGLTTYFARTVAGDLFSDSNKASAAPQISSSIIATVSAPADVIPLKYLQGDFKSYSGNEAYGVIIQQFDGRELPVADFSPGMSRPFTFAASLTDENLLKKLQTLARQQSTVLYRDNSGRKIYGVIDVLPYRVYRGLVDVTITIIETYYSEVVSIA